MNVEILQMIARQKNSFHRDGGEETQKQESRMDHEKASDGPLEALIALGVSVATCCLSSFETQINAARKAGASKAELATAVLAGKRIRQAPMGEIDQKCAQLAI